MRRFGFALLLILMLLTAFPSASRAQELKIPAEVYDRCSRYFTMEVNYAGTTITFYRQDDPAKVCAVVTNIQGSSGVAELLKSLQPRLASFDCWQANLAYESIVPGMDAGFVIAIKCAKGERRVSFTVGYRDGIFIGYVNEW